MLYSSKSKGMRRVITLFVASPHQRELVCAFAFSRDGTANVRSAVEAGLS